MTAIRLGRMAALVAALAMASAGGCSAVGSKGLGLFGSSEPPAAAEPTSTYQILFVPHEGKAEQVTRTLSGTMHIQQALEQAGAHKKFRRIEVELVRPLPQGGFHRIPCDYDRANKQITPEFDYALLPGDRIVVKEDPSTIIDDMLTSALGPMGAKITKRARGVDPKDSRYEVQR